MAKKSVARIGVEIPGEEDRKLSLKSKVSLLDYDVIIIDPAIYEFYRYRSKDYQGKPCLDDTNSFRLKEHLEHWRREILEAIRAGKNIFILLNQKEDVFVATGTESHSGTGKNRQTTRHVSLISNYKIIPGDITVTSSNGSAMTLVGKNNVFAPYWSAVGKISEFKVLLSGEGVKPIIQTKTGQKIVGARLQYKNAEGNLFLLPYIDFNHEKYTYENEEDNETYWTEEAVVLGKKLIDSICAVDKAIKSSGEISAIPDWLMQDKFILPKEKKIRSKLVGIELKIDELQKQKERCEQDISEESILKHLLYENGKTLEAAVHIALKLIGFTVSHFEDSESEFDVVFESNEGRLIGEVEGKDSKAINIDKLRQLEMNIHEDFSKDDVDEIAKGALIGNAYRLSEPEEREEYFTTKCLTAAARSSTALISTIDLFYIAKYLSGKRNKQFAKECRQAIIAATGIVAFPDIPEATKESESIIDEQKNT